MVKKTALPSFFLCVGGEKGTAGGGEVATRETGDERGQEGGGETELRQNGVESRGGRMLYKSCVFI